MTGVFKIKLNGEVIHYTKFSDIPEQIGAVISFMPDYPEPPHKIVELQYQLLLLQLLYLVLMKMLLTKMKLNQYLSVKAI
jgi:hypothetical protein